MSYFRLYKNYF